MSIFTYNINLVIMKTKLKRQGKKRKKERHYERNVKKESQ